MADVLENLQKLPPRCIGTIGGRKVLIQRGVIGYVETELTPELYEHVPVSPAQRQAMEVGCTLGWDKLGANPDIYEQTNSGEEIVERVFTFSVPFQLTVEVTSHSQSLAEAMAERISSNVQKAVQVVVEDMEPVSSFCIDDQMQLIWATEKEKD